MSAYTALRLSWRNCRACSTVPSPSSTIARSGFSSVMVGSPQTFRITTIQKLHHQTLTINTTYGSISVSRGGIGDMPSDVYEFTWRIPEAGFRWVRSRVYVNEERPKALTSHSGLSDRERWVLLESPPAGAPYRVQRYAPLKKHPGLFRTFAEVEPE